MLVLDNIHSISDVITNSSSELFLLDTNTSLDKVKEVISTILDKDSYCDPYIFNAEEYRKWIREIYSNAKPREDYHLPEEVENHPFKTIHDWFFDPENIDDVKCTIYREIYKILVYDKLSAYLELEPSSYKEMVKLIAKGWLTAVKDFERESFNLEEYIEEKLQLFPDRTILECANWLPYEWNIETLEGKIILQDTYDNSIQCSKKFKSDTHDNPIDYLEAMFNAKYYHLG